LSHIAFLATLFLTLATVACSTSPDPEAACRATAAAIEEHNRGNQATLDAIEGRQNTILSSVPSNRPYTSAHRRQLLPLEEQRLVQLKDRQTFLRRTLWDVGGSRCTGERLIVLQRIAAREIDMLDISIQGTEESISAYKKALGGAR
jgi:hypothetical protein